MKPKLLLAALLFFPAIVNANVDFKITAITPMEYQVPGTKDFSITITMLGKSNFYSANFYWQLNNGTIDSVTKVPTDLKWHSLTTGWVTDPAFKVTLPTAGQHKLKVWMKTTTADVNPTNDTLTTNINVFSSLPKKHVLMEVYNYQTNQMCYKTDVYNDNVVLNNTAYTIVNFYTQPTDPLYNANTKAVGDELDGTHAFATMYDRYHFPFWRFPTIPYLTDGTLNITGIYAYGQREQFYEPVEVFFKSATYDSANRELKVLVSATLYDNLSGDYRFNIYLTENGVISPQAGAPNPNSYKHDNVLRAMLGGPWGKQGSLPTSLNSGTTYDYWFTYTIPANYNADSLSLIGLVQKYDTDKYNRPILNSKEASLMSTLSVNNSKTSSKNVHIYPNPTDGNINVALPGDKSYKITATDITGRVLEIIEKSNKTTTFSLDRYAKGLYLIQVFDENNVILKTEKVILK